MGAVLTRCPKCQRQVPVGAMRGFLWWRSCHCCRNPIAAMLYDYVVAPGAIGARERADAINRANLTTRPTEARDDG